MYQKVILVGNLGGDPEMRYMPDGTAVTNFSLATNEQWTDKNTGAPMKKTTWWRCAAWRRQAETCNQYLSRGSKVLVEGKMNPGDNGYPRTFTRQDGTVGASYEITVERVVFLSNKNDGNSDGANYDNVYDAPVAQDEDDIPF